MLWTGGSIKGMGSSMVWNGMVGGMGSSMLWTGGSSMVGAKCKGSSMVRTHCIFSPV